MTTPTIALDKHIINTLDKASRINPNLKIKPDQDYIITLSRAKSMLMTAPIGITLPREVNIYDLKAFLATTGLIDSPVLDFSNASKIIITNEENTVQTSFSDSNADLINNYIDLERFPSIDDEDVAVEVTVSPAIFESVMRSARVRNALFVGFVSDGANISMCSFNKLDSGEIIDTFTVALCPDTLGVEFKKYYKLDNTDLDVLKGEGELTFKISKEKHMSIVNTESDKLLFIVLDPTSTYNAQ